METMGGGVMLLLALLHLSSLCFGTFLMPYLQLDSSCIALELWFLLGSS